MANRLNVFRDGDVGFIDWLDLSATASHNDYDRDTYNECDDRGEYLLHKRQPDSRIRQNKRRSDCGNKYDSNH